MIPMARRNYSMQFFRWKLFSVCFFVFTVADFNNVENLTARGAFQFVDVFLTDGHGGCLLPRELDPFGEKRDGVFRAHAEAGVVGYEAGLLPSYMVAVVVAATDEQYLAVGEPIKVVVPVDAYLAHEHLEHVVGGGQFFPLPSLPDGDASVLVASCGSPFGMW